LATFESTHGLALTRSDQARDRVAANRNGVRRAYGKAATAIAVVINELAVSVTLAFASGHWSCQA